MPLLMLLLVSLFSTALPLDTCHLHSDPSLCPFAALPRNSSALLYPGQPTRCIFDSSTPFAFQVVRRHPARLLLYFQGGGACFNEASTRARLCTSDAEAEAPLEGILATDPRNPYADHTVVVVLYCSGDVHAGDVDREYMVDGSVVRQRGQANTQAVLDWLATQQGRGMAESLESLVVSGESAGALGAQIWAADVATTLRHESMVVLPDSFVGVFPVAYTPRLIREYGVCDWFATKEVRDKCHADELLMPDIMLDQFQRLGPEVPFLFIQSKADAVQIAFYDTIVATEGGEEGEGIPAEDFYDKANLVLQTYLGYNMATFFVEGVTHTFTDEEYFYTTSIYGDRSAGVAFEDMLQHWVRGLGVTGAACEKCNGDAGTVDDGDDVRYCDERLASTCATTAAIA